MRNKTLYKKIIGKYTFRIVEFETQLGTDICVTRTLGERKNMVSWYYGYSKSYWSNEKLIKYANHLKEYWWR